MSTHDTRLERYLSDARRIQTCFGRIALGMFVLVQLFLVTPVVRAQPNVNITITKLNDLNFSQVVSGESKMISPQGAGPAKFAIEVDKGNNQYDVQLILPPVLSLGSSTVGMTYGPGSASYSLVDNNAASTTFDPASGLVASLKANETLYVWIGGTVTASGSPTPGTHTETLVINVTQQ